MLERGVGSLPNGFILAVRPVAGSGTKQAEHQALWELSLDVSYCPLIYGQSHGGSLGNFATGESGRHELQRNINKSHRDPIAFLRCGV